MSRLHYVANDSSSACIRIEFKNHNSLSFCNATRPWQPRLSENEALIAFTVVSIYSCILTIMTMYRYHVLGTLKILYFKLRVSQITEQSECDFSGNCFSKTLKKIKTWITLKFQILDIVVLPLFAILWNCIDGVLDAYTFYQLEIGKLIDGNIHRTAHVSNAILAFAILGATSNILKIKLWSKFQSNTEYESDEKKRFEYKRYAMFISFFFEDAAELILEYFYIQRYVTLTPPYYLYVKDAIIALLLVKDVISYLKEERKAFGQLLLRAFCECNLFLLISITSSLSLLVSQGIRLAGQWIQFSASSVPQQCFGVFDGMIYQQPFEKGCLRDFEMALMVFTGIPVIKALAALCVFTCSETKLSLKIFKACLWLCCDTKDKEKKKRKDRNKIDLEEMTSPWSALKQARNLAQTITEQPVFASNLETLNDIETGPESIDYLEPHLSERPKGEHQVFCCQCHGINSFEQLASYCCFISTCCCCCRFDMMDSFLFKDDDVFSPVKNETHHSDKGNDEDGEIDNNSVDDDQRINSKDNVGDGDGDRGVTTLSM